MRGKLSLALLAAGLLAATVALLDPRRGAGILVGPLLAALGAAVAPVPRRKGVVLGAVLAAAFALSAAARPEFSADSPSYFEYLRSLAFDHDLDFANERAHWRYPPGANTESIGPALLWAPFYAVSHLYVRVDAAAGGPYRADGYSVPYERATATGTITIALIGALLLGRTLARRYDPPVGWTALAGVVLASPVVFYVFVVPSMAHGLAFGLAAALVFAWDRARAAPSLRAWLVLGALLGLCTLVRWQALVLTLLVLPLALLQLRRRQARFAWLAAGAGAALLAVSPQLLAWHAMFGRFVTVPQGPGFLDWSSPHVLDTLVSANHGLLSWTPVAALGLIGLFLELPGDPLLAGSALAAVTATAWINGAALDPSGGDAFGARRFDIVLPLLALGLARLVDGLRGLAGRRPLLLPALLLLLLGAWNLGLVASFRSGRFGEAAPLDRVAAEEARHLRRMAQGVLGVFGPRGRALAYKYFSGEYLYTSYNREGVIDPWNADPQDLLSGWGGRTARHVTPSCRWALYPEACLRVPLEQPEERPLTIAVSAPGRAQPQSVTVLVNGRAVGAAAVPVEGALVQLTLPARSLVAGENTLCLRFARAVPGDARAPLAACVGPVALR